MDVKYKKPVFNKFKNMKNSDKKIPANLRKNKGCSKFHLGGSTSKSVIGEGFGNANINAMYIFTMSLRTLEGRGNASLRAKRGNLIQEIVIARSGATWQSQPFFMKLLRPCGARNDKRKNLLRSSR